MRIDFLGGPRDGDYTEQGFEPPSVYMIPVDTSPETYYKRPVDIREYPPDVTYYVYELIVPSIGDQRRYQYTGVSDA